MSRNSSERAPRGTIDWCRQFPATSIPLLTYSGKGTARDVLSYLSFWFAQIERFERTIRY